METTWSSETYGEFTTFFFMYPPATTTSEDQAAVIGDRVVALAVDSYTSDKMYAYHKTRAYLGALSLVMSVRIEQLGSY